MTYKEMLLAYKPVIVDLTQDQLEAIAPIIDLAVLAADASEPGMVVAQIQGGQMKVGFLSHDKAKKMAKKDASGRPITQTRLEASQ